MLTRLYIQNIAVIHKASIDFSGGFNVFTGETGAGKTILIGAIDAVLGERTSRDIIRTGEDKALVSALFEDISPKAVAALEEQGYEAEGGSVLIVREITVGGKNNCKINGMPATTALLREISSLLISVHGQRDGNQLLAADRHMGLIDSYGQLEGILEAYETDYEAMRGIQADLDELRMDDSQKMQRIDMLTYQVAEIEEAELEDPEEEDSLQARRKMLRNSERIREGLAQGYEALQGDGEGAGINDLFGGLVDGVAEAARFMEDMEPLAKRLEEMSYELAEAAADVRQALDEFEFDQRELDAIEERLDVIYRLKRKYGGSITDILAFYENSREELERITTSEQRTQELTKALAVAEKQAKISAKELSARRRTAAQAFVTEVEAELVYLDMPSVRLSLRWQEKSLSPTGMDDMEFMVITNVGEEPKPLSRIASGGEIARMMLAIKNVMADRDDIGTLIFDEVDTGVSGRAAGKIGAKLRAVSQKRQVICVTHLAQVAACGDRHLFIYKDVDDDRTYTHVEPLEGEAVYRELARITSGDMITEAALENARQMFLRAHE